MHKAVNQLLFDIYLHVADKTGGTYESMLILAITAAMKCNCAPIMFIMNRA